jgi:hypothetical protein
MFTSLTPVRDVDEIADSLIGQSDNKIVQASLRNAQDLDVLTEIFVISSRTKMNSVPTKFFTADRGFISLVM